MTKTFSLKFEGYWRENLLKGLPFASGVYCVYKAQYHKENDKVSLLELLYIGESRNVKQRIEEHEKLTEWKKHLNNKQELCFSFAPVSSDSRTQVEAALIFHHKPPENTEYKFSFPFEHTSLVLEGKTALLDEIFFVTRTPSTLFSR